MCIWERARWMCVHICMRAPVCAHVLRHLYIRVRLFMCVDHCASLMAVQLSVHSRGQCKLKRLSERLKFGPVVLFRCKKFNYQRAIACGQECGGHVYLTQPVPFPHARSISKWLSFTFCHHLPAIVAAFIIFASSLWTSQIPIPLF